MVTVLVSTILSGVNFLSAGLKFVDLAQAANALLFTSVQRSSMDDNWPVIVV